MWDIIPNSFWYFTFVSRTTAKSFPCYLISQALLIELASISSCLSTTPKYSSTFSHPISLSSRTKETIHPAPDTAAPECIDCISSSRGTHARPLFVKISPDYRFTPRYYVLVVYWLLVLWINFYSSFRFMGALMVGTICLFVRWFELDVSLIRLML